MFSKRWQMLMLRAMPMVIKSIIKIRNFGLNKKNLDPIGDIKVFTKWQNMSLFTWWTNSPCNWRKMGKNDTQSANGKLPRGCCCVFLGNFMEISTEFPRKSLFQKKITKIHIFFPSIKWYPYQYISEQKKTR